MIAPRLKARLKRLAVHLRCRPTHGTPLWCGLCDYKWTGTDGEFAELAPLAERLSPYFAHLPPSGQICRCGWRLWCRPCYETAAATIHVPDDLMTPEELTRYTELLQHMQRTTPRGDPAPRPSYSPYRDR
jgi:hypothetical protein